MAIPFFRRRLRATLLLSTLTFAALLIWSGMEQTGSTLQIRAGQQGNNMPDGFYVWHHLDANGIQFKSITPDNNALLIKFDSSAQSEAARAVLHEKLPQGYVIAQQDDDNQAGN